MSAALLVLLAVLDAAFAGFRASAGRDARIRKRQANLRAARRGLLVGAPLLPAAALVAGAVLVAADDRTARFRELVAAGDRAALVVVPYALVVFAGLGCYLLGSFRVGTLAMVIGLGPLTMLRPLVVVGAVAAAGWHSPAGAAVTATTGLGLLLVEPLVHRRWYPAPA
ncbi:hypothetical protein [Kitasatospora sp. NPDC051914]|uniref:hypothetical protein n=1 Tax=Kitasatospora sp. NPDC051914 TaxID=3154945 RepID=UPI00343A4DDE